MINRVSGVNLFKSQLATCFLEGPDGFFGLFGEVLFEVALLLILFPVELLPPPLFGDFFIFLLALDIELASESVSSDSRLIPNEGLYDQNSKNRKKILKTVNTFNRLISFLVKP